MDILGVVPPGLFHAMRAGASSLRSCGVQVLGKLHCYRFLVCPRLCMCAPAQSADRSMSTIEIKRHIVLPIFFGIDSSFVARATMSHGAGVSNVLCSLRPASFAASEILHSPSSKLHHRLFTPSTQSTVDWNNLLRHLALHLLPHYCGGTFTGSRSQCPSLLLAYGMLRALPHPIL